MLTACLSVALPVLFAWKPGHAPHQWLVIVPLPFLLWSAVRFGPGTLGLHLLVVVLVALLCTRAGRGPFATGSVAQIIVALQGFFLFISIPLMLLAALVWQYAQAAASLLRSQETIKQSEEQVRHFVRHVPAAVAMFDRDMRYLIYSPRWLTDYKLGDQDLVGRSHYEVFPEIPERWKEVHRRCLAGAVEVYDDDSFVRTDGSTDWLRWEVRPWRNARNEIGGIIMFTEVITERKRAEEEHRRLMAQARVAEALREVDRRKDEFLAMLSHELRNPLAPIATAVEIMRLREPSDESIVWARDVIARQTAQLTRLVDDLLDVSRITLGKITLNRSALDLRPIVAQAVEAVQPLLTARHHHLAIDMSAEPLPIRGDGARLTQIISNLLNNAARFTADGGHIVLAARREGARVVLSVKDDGVGIPPDMRERVFDMFTQIEWPGQRKQDGLGIGLALVKRLVEMHDGDIEARSAGAGRGSELVVRLPIAEDDRTIGDAAAPGARRRARTAAGADPGRRRQRRRGRDPVASAAACGPRGAGGARRPVGAGGRAGDEPRGRVARHRPARAGRARGGEAPARARRRPAPPARGHHRLRPGRGPRAHRRGRLRSPPDQARRPEAVADADGGRPRGARVAGDRGRDCTRGGPDRPRRIPHRRYRLGPIWRDGHEPRVATRIGDGSRPMGGDRWAPRRHGMFLEAARERLSGAA